MPTKLAIDDRLIEEARKIGSHKTKKAAVTSALIEYIRLRQQRAILKLEGKMEFRRRYDYKLLRCGRVTRGAK